MCRTVALGQAFDDAAQKRTMLLRAGLAMLFLVGSFSMRFTHFADLLFTSNCSSFFPHSFIYPVSACLSKSIDRLKI